MWYENNCFVLYIVVVFSSLLINVFFYCFFIIQFFLINERRTVCSRQALLCSIDLICNRCSAIFSDVASRILNQVRLTGGGNTYRSRDGNYEWNPNYVNWLIIYYMSTHKINQTGRSCSVFYLESYKTGSI